MTSSQCCKLEAAATTSRGREARKCKAHVTNFNAASNSLISTAIHVWLKNVCFHSELLESLLLLAASLNLEGRQETFVVVYFVAGSSVLSKQRSGLAASNVWFELELEERTNDRKLFSPRTQLASLFDFRTSSLPLGAAWHV